MARMDDDGDEHLMSTNPNLIELGDPDYETIYNRWQMQKGKQIDFQGGIWRVVKDGAVIKFARIGSGDVDAAYASNSMPSQ